MKMTTMRTPQIFLAGLMFIFASHKAEGATVILKNGAFVEGEVTLQTSTTLRLKTRFGTRTFNKKDIEQVIQAEGSAESADAKSFNDLPPVMKAVLNAEVDYELKNYERALSRLEPLRDYEENKPIRMRIDWLIIEINQRLGKWDDAKNLLRAKLEKGSPPEKTRAQAHLDILEVNPEFDLRYVGKKQLRNFLFSEDLRNRAREAGSLKDDEIMRLALEEYCEQLLSEEKQGIKSFTAKLDVKTTIDAIKKAPGSGDLTNHLPYLSDLKSAEASLFKAQSILGDYGMAFELDLTRAELNHLILVAGQLDAALGQVDPYTFNPPADQRTGQLTPEGRRQWQQRCDEYLMALKPYIRLLEYIDAKTQRYPQELRNIHELTVSMLERFNQVTKTVKKARDRTHV